MSDASDKAVPEPAADGSYDRPHWPGQWRWTRGMERPSPPITVTRNKDDELIVGNCWTIRSSWISNEGRRWHPLTPRPEAASDIAPPQEALAALNAGGKGTAGGEDERSEAWRSWLCGTEAEPHPPGVERERRIFAKFHDSITAALDKAGAPAADNPMLRVAALKDALSAELADAKRERDALESEADRQRQRRKEVEAVNAELRGQLDAGRHPTAAKADAWKAGVKDLTNRAFESGYRLGADVAGFLAARGAEGGAP